MAVEFTAHNIRLDDGTLTMPGKARAMSAYPWFLSTRRILETTFPGDKSGLRLADLGCLEGGYAVEFARMGFQVLGVEVRDANIAACNYVKSKVDLPNLAFVQDDVLNIAKYGTFDAIFCCGLFYHLEHPRQYLATLSAITRKLLVLQTHFATDSLYARLPLPLLVRKAMRKLTRQRVDRYLLSARCEHEGLAGRWYPEFSDEQEFTQRADARWASWGNSRSFWIERGALLQAIQAVGFDLVMEQFDNLGPDIAENLRRGHYQIHNRGTFIGIKTEGRSERAATPGAR